MAEFNKKKDKYPFWHSPLMLIVLFAILILFAYNMVGLFGRERETNKNKVLELNKIEELRSRQASLASDIEKLKTDRGIEDTIRDKFQVTKPGEQMVVIVDDKTSEDAMPPLPEDHSFWGFIKSMFEKNK